jgi:hypothetical protein
MCQSDTAVKSSQNRGYEIAVHSEWRMVLKPGARPAKIPDDIAMRWSCQVSKVPALGTKSGRPWMRYPSGNSSTLTPAVLSMLATAARRSVSL